MKITTLAIAKLEANRGQIDGLPKNPRKWTSDDVDVLCRSIEGTPQLMEARPIIVVPHGKKYVVIGGNMRLEAIRRLGWKNTHCIIFDDLTTEELKAIVIKDNSSFGEWDTDELANQWDDLPIGDWGVHIAGVEVAGKEFHNTEVDTGDWDEEMKMKFKFTKTEMQTINTYFADKEPRVEILKLVGYGE